MIDDPYHPHVLDPGHVYELPQFHVDGFMDLGIVEKLTFLKRSGGSVKHETQHAGTNVQSVVRVLIDRTKYLNELVPATEDGDALYYLRMVLLCYEGRAWRRKLDKVNRGTKAHTSFRERDRDLPFDDLGFIGADDRSGIENLPCGVDGLIVPEEFNP